MTGNIVLGAYFAGKPHPQHDWSVLPKSFDYFADWYHSIRRLGLNAILLHDHLDLKQAQDIKLAKNQ